MDLNSGISNPNVILIRERCTLWKFAVHYVIGYYASGFHAL